MSSPIDWHSIGRGGQRALGLPTLWVAAVSAVVVVTFLVTTLTISGGIGWVLKIVAIALCVPVVWLIVRRQQVLHRFAELERTGEHPDNVVHATGPDGQEIEVIVPGAEKTVVPRLGVSGLAALAISSLAAAGIALALLIVTGLARLL